MVRHIPTDNPGDESRRVIMLAVWLALDPLFANTSILLGVLAGMIIAAIICIMIAIDILLRAYMHKQQDEHHEEVLM